MIDLILVGTGVAGLVVSLPYVGYVSYIHKFKVVDVFKNAMKNADIDEARSALELLHNFDIKYSTEKVIKMKEKYGIIDEIMNDRTLFRLKFDSKFLLQKYIEKNSDVINNDNNFSDDKINYELTEKRLNKKAEEIRKREEMIETILREIQDNELLEYNI
jgi:hypothetical protein